MTHKTLIARIRSVDIVTARQADACLEMVAKALIEELFATGRAKIPGLGTFHLTHRQARAGRNPRTNEPIHVPERVAITFTEATDMRARLRSEFPK